MAGDILQQGQEVKSSCGRDRGKFVLKKLFSLNADFMDSFSAALGPDLLKKQNTHLQESASSRRH